MSEITPASGGPSRQLFVILAIGLGGLLLLGVLGLGGWFVLNSLTARPPATPTLIARTATPRPVVLAQATATEAPTNTPVLPTAAPLPTNTPSSGTPATGATVTLTPGTGTPGGNLPDTGLGEDLLLVAGGVVLVLIIFAARKARATGSA
ncbi:MAG: hypothetical protein HZC40_10935 [Chloroflexi bacterium]|nr:hypothetical protein [Chloroflexota bacterium]